MSLYAKQKQNKKFFFREKDILDGGYEDVMDCGKSDHVTRKIHVDKMFIVWHNSSPTRIN